MKNGILYLVPSYLSESNPEKVFPSFNLQVLTGIRIFIVENVRTSRRFLRSVGYLTDFDEVTFHVLNKHTDSRVIFSFLTEIENGKDIALLSEAGTPCIADPGALIVHYAQQKNIAVKPLVGPNSILLALMASGMNGQSFVFHGYLPIDEKELRNQLKEMEKNIIRFDQTQIFIETPYRNLRLFNMIVKSVSDNFNLCMASDISGQNESIKTMKINQWKKRKIDIHKIPTVFLIYK